MNWYNLPTYYDVSFSHEMREEFVFLKRLFNKYCKAATPRLLEPACGTGRLIIPLAKSGFHCTGFDLNEYALQYLLEKLERNRLNANIFMDDMASFKNQGKKYDAAYCTVDTFRHLTSSKLATQHLVRVANSLKKNGLYVLGLHLIPEHGVITKTTNWTAKRGRLTVKTSMKFLKLDKINRTETLKVTLKSKTDKQSQQYESIYKLRTYTLKQFNSLLIKTNVFEIMETYDHYYDLSKPIRLDNRSDYAVFVLRKKG